MKVASSQHIPVLDGVRAIAVLMVIAFHFWMVIGNRPWTLVGRAASWGTTGVDLFFVLSGFLITGILLDTKGSEHSLRNFYLRRAVRIFPLYYATLIGFYLVAPLVGLDQWAPWSKSIWYLVYVQNIVLSFAPSMLSGPLHFWSLAVEEQYYLLWPLLVMRLDRTKLLWVTAGAIGAGIISRILFFPSDAMVYLTICRIDGLAMGSALAILARGPSGGLKRYVPWAKAGFWALALGMPAVFLVFHGDDRVTRVLKTTFVSLLYTVCLALALEQRVGGLVQRLLSSKFMGSIGRYSYGMYVFHLILMVWLAKAGLRYNFVNFVMVAALIYVTAWISWTLMEKRFLALKRHFEYRPTPAG